MGLSKAPTPKSLPPLSMGIKGILEGGEPRPPSHASPSPRPRASPSLPPSSSSFPSPFSSSTASSSSSPYSKPAAPVPPNPRSSQPHSLSLASLAYYSSATLPLNPSQLLPFLSQHGDHIPLPLLPAHLLLAALQPLSLSPNGSPRAAPLLDTTSQSGRRIAIWTRRAFSNGSSLSVLRCSVPAANVRLPAASCCGCSSWAIWASSLRQRRGRRLSWWRCCRDGGTTTVQGHDDSSSNVPRRLFSSSSGSSDVGSTGTKCFRSNVGAWTQRIGCCLYGVNGLWTPGISCRSLSVSGELCSSNIVRSVVRRSHGSVRSHGLPTWGCSPRLPIARSTQEGVRSELLPLNTCE